MADVYMQCPVVESDHFILRLVEPHDAADLLSCYGHSESIPFLNEDHFTYAFGRPDLTIAEMEKNIHMWLEAYRERGFVRFSIVTKTGGQAVGTIEMFNWNGAPGGMGVLRLDLNPKHESKSALSELLHLSDLFFEMFDCGKILTKGFEKSQARMDALKVSGYKPFPRHEDFARDGYWVKERQT